MENTRFHTLDSYEENRNVQKQISAILSDSSSTREKERKLQKLKDSVHTPLSKSHIAYFQNKIKTQRRVFYSRILAAPWIIAYLFFTLYRMYYFIYPEKPHYELNLPFFPMDATLFFGMIPIWILLFYLIQYLISEKNK